MVQDTLSKQNNPAIMDQVALLSFVDRLIKERNDPNITPDVLPQVRNMLLREANVAIRGHLLDCLSISDAIQFEDLLKKEPTDDQIDDFLEEKIPNIEIEIANALLNFRTAYLLPQAAKRIEESKNIAEDPLTPPPAPES